MKDTTNLPSMIWSIEDIQQHANNNCKFPNEEETENMLEEFFEEHEDSIMEFINERMADFVYRYYNQSN
ncbi:MAG: hypothetical protein ACO3FS_06990 [Flavobacteriaceae bacterium]